MKYKYNKKRKFHKFVRIEQVLCGTKRGYYEQGKPITCSKCLKIMSNESKEEALKTLSEAGT